MNLHIVLEAGMRISTLQTVLPYGYVKLPRFRPCGKFAPSYTARHAPTTTSMWDPCVCVCVYQSFAIAIQAGRLGLPLPSTLHA